MKLHHAWSRNASRKDSTRWGAGTTDSQAQRLLDAYLLDRIKANIPAYQEDRFRLKDDFAAQQILYADSPCQREALRAALHCLAWSAVNKRLLPGLYALLNHLLLSHLTDDAVMAESAPALWNIFANNHFYISERGVELSALLTLAEMEISRHNAPLPALRTFLGRMRQYWVNFRPPYDGRISETERESKFRRLVDKNNALLAHYETFLPGSGEAWGEAAMDDFARMEPAQQSAWKALFAHLATADKSKPTAAWLKKAGQLMDSIGRPVFREHAARWLKTLPPSPSYLLQTELIAPTRGLLWCCSLESDADLARAVGKAAACYFARLPDIGPRCTLVGNAAVYALGQMSHPEAIAQLIQLRHAITYNQVQTQINKALAVAANAAQLSPEELEEIGVPTGSQQAEEDAALLAIQRDRLEALLMSSRDWDRQTWNERYAQHPLLSDMAGRLIWQFDTDTDTATGIRHNGSWVDAYGKPISFLQDAQSEQANVRVRLWHPAHPGPVVPAVALQWRRFLEAQGITQPFPQAHREIYLLTEEEKRTGTYSTRFAAQILRHYHFDKQMEQRRWKYDASVPDLRILRLLPHYGLRVEWNLERTDNEGLFMEAAAITLVTSGSVQFRDAQGIMNVADVPPRIYSEMMREIGLLASGSCVGENPLWRVDGAGAQTADRSPAALAQSRHRILATLLPRLRMADRLSLETNKLIVRGDWHTYGIDLITSAVGMGAEQRYVCIQPKSTPLSPDERGSALLPYEGDPMLALILSKAFLLCQDSATTDKVILAQIHPDAPTRRQQAG